jgi:hypothetical protein
MWEFRLKSDRKPQSMFIMNYVLWAIYAISSYFSVVTILICVEYVKNHIFKPRREFQVTFTAIVLMTCGQTTPTQ